MSTQPLQVVADEARRVDLALTTIPKNEGYDELMVVRDIPFRACRCEVCTRPRLAP